MTRAALALLLGCLLGGAGPLAGQTGVVNTRHNLSASAPNPIRAVSEQEVCVFCHTPHSSRTDAPLWNRSQSTANYTPYSGASLQAAPGQPNGSSKLCLSCHDGTIALGGVLNAPNTTGVSPIPMTGTDPQGRLPSGTTLIGTNLGDDHPVSFVYDQALQTADGELVNPLALTGAVQLHVGTTPGVRNTLQCATCHEPHTDQLPKFLRATPRGRTDNLCLTCHQKPGWVGSSHESSTKTVLLGGVSATMDQHSCLTCHAPHTTSGAERLLRNGATGGLSAIERTCYQCHTTGGVGKNLESEFGKISLHPVARSSDAGRHRPVFLSPPPAGLPENVALNPGSPAPDPRFVDAQHVECVDCHNPHRATAANPLAGMRGIGLAGNVITSPRNDSGAAGPSEQFAICLRCHGDTWGTAVPATLPSGLTARNKRTEFQPGNSAFHPVGGPGRNTSANLNLQLVGGLTVNSVLKCTDCHNSNAFAASTGKVVRSPGGSASGPHGSSNPALLRANYRLTLNVTSYNAGNFDLCWRCHGETQLFGTRTNFWDAIDGKDNLHELHLRDRIAKSGAICRSCHFNAHSNVEATNTQYNINGFTTTTPPGATPTRMVNFHPNIRPIGGRARPEWWLNTATRERRCYLECHSAGGGVGGGEVMNGESGSGGKRARYRPTSGDLP